MIARIPKMVHLTSNIYQRYLKVKDDKNIVFPFQSDLPDCNFIPVSVEEVNYSGNNDFANLQVAISTISLENMTMFEPILVKDTQSLYIGQFQDNQRHGYGLLIYTDGSFYEGQFINDKPSGLGKIYYCDGSYYQGQFKEAEKHGNGTYTGPNKELIKGYFKKDQIIGQAKVVYPDKAQYKGELSDYKKEGTGKFIFQNEDFYEGQFKNDLFEGKGKFHRKKDDTSFEGQWKKNRLLNPCKILYANQSIYEGEVNNFLKYGKGKLREFEKTYEGTWENDMKQGIFQISTDGCQKTKTALFENNEFQKFLNETTSLTPKQKNIKKSKDVQNQNSIEKRPNTTHQCRFFCF